MFQNKLKAFTIHLIFSVIAVSIITSAIVYFWYPLDYLGITSFKEIALLIISIDLIMGPLLTFVVYNPKKKSLRFDLAVIIILQISALAYGSYFLYQGHPVFITYAKGSFTLVNAKLAKPANAKYDEYKITKLSSAKLAYAELPKDALAKDKLLDDSMIGGADLEERADLYKPYKQHINDIVAKSLDTVKLFSDQQSNNETVLFKKDYGDNIDNFAFLPLEGSTKDAIIVLDKKTAEFVTTIGVDPWKYTKK